MRQLIVAVMLIFGGAHLAFGQAVFPPAALAFPQIAVGGDAGAENYATLIQIVNNNSAPTAGRIELLSGDGSPLAVLFDGEGPISSAEIPLESGETRQIRLTMDGPVTAGWLHITYSPSDALTTVILQFHSGTKLLSEIGVKPEFNLMWNTAIPIETDASGSTGIAVANPASGPAYLLAQLWEPENGTPVAGTIISLPPGGHISRFVTELFQSVPGIAQIRAKVSLDSCSLS